MFLAKLNEVLSSKKSFISDRLNFAQHGIALLINIIHWVILFINIPPGQESIVLHYNIIYGADLVERASYVYAIPTLSLLLFIANFFLSGYLYQREKLATYFLNIASISIQLIFIAASIALIVINQ